MVATTTPSPVIERPGSPISSGIERATKKVRNKDSEVLILGDLIMEDMRLPYRFYNKKLLRFIAGTLGKVVKVDYNTTTGKKGKFARFAIVIDLNKPLKEFVGINETEVVIPTTNAFRPSPSTIENIVARQSCYGPWMQLVRECIRQAWVGHKLQNKLIIAEWVESLLKKLNDSNKTFGIDRENEAPIVSERKANDIIRRTSIDFLYKVKAKGFSRGIWLLWSEKLVIDVVE
ncbi:hypothetical protein Gorai_006336, partial [Gossypium raimondii]|nr:hypothetical protein [Gossypium raimondii]